MAYKIGDIVMRLDGDGRPHNFFVYHYEDGGSDISDSRFIKPYNRK